SHFITQLPQSYTLFPYTTLFRSIFRESLALLWAWMVRSKHIVPSTLTAWLPGPTVMLTSLPAVMLLTLTVSGPAAPRLMRSALRSEEHTSELQSRFDLVCRLLLE